VGVGMYRVAVYSILKFVDAVLYCVNNKHNLQKKHH